MKYFEILVTAKTANSYYEGNYYVKADCVSSAVSKVTTFLEIDNSFRVYTREISYQTYLLKLNVADKKSKIKSDLLSSDFGLNFDSIGFDKVTSTAVKLDFVDLSMFD